MLVSRIFLLLILALMTTSLAQKDYLKEYFKDGLLIEKSYTECKISVFASYFLFKL